MLRHIQHCQEIRIEPSVHKTNKGTFPRHILHAARTCPLNYIPIYIYISQASPARHWNISYSGQIGDLLLDFSNASDKVPHHHLATKLHQYGMRGKTVEWVKSYLSSRTQEVIMEGKSLHRPQSPQASHRDLYLHPSSSFAI